MARSIGYMYIVYSLGEEQETLKQTSESQHAHAIQQSPDKITA